MISISLLTFTDGIIPHKLWINKFVCAQNNVNSVSSDVIFHSDSTNRDAFFVCLNYSFLIYRLFGATMKKAMTFVISEFQIGKGKILSIVIPVVHYFISCESSSKTFFHNPPVNKISDAVASYSWIQNRGFHA